MAVRGESRRELWFWRASAGAALSVCAFLPFQGTQASVAEREPEPQQLEAVAQAPRRPRSGSSTLDSARVRRLLASLERSQSTSNRCMTIDRLSRLPELDENGVAQLARFSEEGQPVELRRCTGYALGNVAHVAALEPLKALAQSENKMLAETALMALAGRSDRASQRAAIELSAQRSRTLRVSVACALAESGATEAVSLIAALLGDGNGMERERLLMALGRCGDPRAVGVLQGYIAQGNRMTQQSAIYALGEIGGPAASETLLALLRDRPELAQLAAGALARSGGDEAREALLSIAEQNLGYGTGFPALQALSELDGPGVPELMSRALDGTVGAQSIAMEYFVNHPEHDVFERLETFARSGTVQAQSQALQALARIGGDQAFDVIESVALGGGSMAPMALQMLSQDGSERARRIALAQMKKGNASGIEILVQDESPEARAALIELAQKGDPNSAQRALWSLAQRNDPESRKLTEALATNADPQKRASAMWALAQTGDPAVIGTLRKAMSDSDENVRREAVQALGQLPGAESEAALLSATRDASPDVVGVAANVLAGIGSAKAIERLEEITRNPATAGQGMMALLNSAPARAQPLAEAMISSASIESRRAALMASSQLPSEASTHILVTALADRDADFVREAVEMSANGVQNDQVRAALRGLSDGLPEDLRQRAAEIAGGTSNGMAAPWERAHRID